MNWIERLTKKINDVTLGVQEDVISFQRKGKYMGLIRNFVKKFQKKRRLKPDVEDTWAGFRRMFE